MLIPAMWNIFLIFITIMMMPVDLEYKPLVPGKKKKSHRQVVLTFLINRVGEGRAINASKPSSSLNPTSRTRSTRGRGEIGATVIST